MPRTARFSFLKTGSFLMCPDHRRKPYRQGLVPSLLMGPKVNDRQGADAFHAFETQPLVWLHRRKNHDLSKLP